MAAPGSDDTDHLSKVEGPTEAPAPEASAPKGAPPARRRAGSFLSKLLFSAIALLIVLGIAGYGALIFRDADPRVGIAASYVEDGLAEAQGALDKAQASLAELTGQAPPPSKTTARRMLGQIKPAPTPEPNPTPAAEPEKAPEPVAPAPIEAAKEPETPAVVENAAPEPRSEPAPEPPRRPTDIAEAPAPAPLPAPAPVAAAPVAAEPARPAAPVVAAEARDADGFTDRDLISALEGRIDAMSDEIMSLRQKLDAPKNETRAAPEAEAPKPAAAPAPAPVADNAGTTVVVAFALQRELEKGRPFAEEIAALSRLGAEPAPAPVLIEYSEKGAPTGEQLRETFLPIAKKLKAHETPADTHAESGDIAGHLLEGASKLIKVRPSGHAHPDSYEGRIEKIETALAHDDFAAATAAFDSLPEHARTEAKAFGETLQQRAEAARAAEELLHGAIAALGKK